MFKKALKIVVALALGIVVFALPSRANETGLSGMHANVRIGNRLCHASHLHHGSGSGTSKRAAIKKAVKAWSSFTAWEYGSDWARFSRAVGKNADCTASSGRAWRCNVRARACRSYAGPRRTRGSKIARFRRR